MFVVKWIGVGKVKYHSDYVYNDEYSADGYINFCEMYFFVMGVND